jgi:protein-disulfide isomerase
MVLATVGGLGLAAVVIGIALVQSGFFGQGIRTPATVYPAELVDGDVLGSGQAPVVMELYADFQCPACRIFVTKQLDKLVADFVVDGTLRIEARDIAFLGRGQPDESLELAAGARCAVDQGRYWQFHDYVFWNQGRENRGDHNSAFIERMAGAAGVELSAFRACMARTDLRPVISTETDAAVAAGIQSTPTLVINGRRIVGVPQYDQLSEVIRQAAQAATAGR